MARIVDVQFRGGKASRYVEFFEGQVTIEFEETNEPAYTLHGYIAEKDGRKDNYYVRSDGSIHREREGGHDDYVKELWIYTLLAGNSGRFTQPLVRYEEDVEHTDIHERTGEFYPIVTLVPHNTAQIYVGDPIPVRVTG